MIRSRDEAACLFVRRLGGFERGCAPFERRPHDAAGALHLLPPTPRPLGRGRSAGRRVQRQLLPLLRRGHRRVLARDRLCLSPGDRRSGNGHLRDQSDRGVSRVGRIRPAARCGLPGRAHRPDVDGLPVRDLAWRRAPHQRRADLRERGPEDEAVRPLAGFPAREDSRLREHAARGRRADARLGAARRGEPIDHRFDGRDLRSGPGHVLAPGVAPPVPATPRIEHEAPVQPGHSPAVAADRLRVEHDQPVRIRPAVVPRLAHEALADRLHALPAAMERHVHAALRRLARARHVRIAGVRHADRVGISRGESLLVIPDDAPRLLCRGRVQRAKQMLEQLAGRVEVTIVDERRSGDRTCPACALGDHRVARGLVLYERDPLRRNAVARIELAQGVDDRRIHGPVARPREEPHSRTREVVRGVDRPRAREHLRLRSQLVDSRQRRPGPRRHAVVVRGDHRTLRAVVRPGGENPRSCHDAGVRHVELHCHVSAGGDPRDRHGARIGAECG